MARGFGPQRKVRRVDDDDLDAGRRLGYAVCRFSGIVYGFSYQRRPESIEQQAPHGDEQEDPCYVPGAKAARP